MEMGKYTDMGKIFHEREKKDSTAEFLRNIILNGFYGNYDPAKCHHPFTNIVPLMDPTRTLNKNPQEPRYFAIECRDCGKIFEIFGPR